MIRRFNYTKRTQIRRAHVRIYLREVISDETPVFDANLELESYSFDGDARVRIEAWRSNSIQRWDFGSVANITPPSEERRRLTEVPSPAQFRVFVVANDGSGRLLGHAPRIRPVFPNRSLIPLRETDDLGEEVWRIDFGDGGDSPELLVNSRIQGISEIVRKDPSFRALIMPEVLRTVLMQSLLVDRANPTDDETVWSPWFRLAQQLLPDSAAPSVIEFSGVLDTAQARQWIDKVVASFATSSIGAARMYGEALEQ